MKIKKFLPIISIVIALLLGIQKLWLDLEITDLTSPKSSSNGLSPSIVAGSIKIQLFLFAIFLIPLFLSIIGYRDKSPLSKPSLILHIIIG
ncbi:MAG: hypothetical protein KJO64_04770, partial [Bacteroidia bacterium]|nr:hypothetical protein [Bacteroidia bacterium]